jgi:hypothetical protein
VRSFKRDADERQTDRPPFFDRGPDSPAVTQASPPMSFSPSRLPHHRSHLKTNLRAPESRDAGWKGQIMQLDCPKAGWQRSRPRPAVRSYVGRLSGMRGAQVQDQPGVFVQPSNRATIPRLTSEGLLVRQIYL